MTFRLESRVKAIGTAGVVSDVPPRKIAAEGGAARDRFSDTALDVVVCRFTAAEQEEAQEAHVDRQDQDQQLA